MLAKSFALVIALAFGASIVLAQDDHKDHKGGDQHGDHPRNTVVQRHPQIFRNHVPAPGHHGKHKHKVWVKPHWDKGHRHLIKGHFIYVWK